MTVKDQIINILTDFDVITACEIAEEILQDWRKSGERKK